MNEPISLVDQLDRKADFSEAEVDVYRESDDYRAFGFNRKSVNSDPMINLVDSRGVQEALAYGHLYRLRFDPSEGITLEFTEHVVTIRGRGLREGYQRLAMQRVVFIAEADRATAVLVPEKEPVITSLIIMHKREIPIGE